ncbi:MAG: class I SAM-dependent methyltransferase [Rhodospirillaceae bacterium]|nr:class I SAM-dependent methyltransferase [Rhodospirillaceae bacterium]
MNRRETLAIAPMLTALAIATHSTSAAAKTTDVKIDPYNQTPEQEARHAVRLPKLDQQSVQDFLSSFRAAIGKEFRPMRAVLEKSLAAKGLTMDADISPEAAWTTLMQHPQYAMSARLWMSTQQQMWANIYGIFHANAEAVLAELEKADTSGPGRLELNPDLNIPDYTRHEIHIQPGGYVGDPFAGAISHYGFKQFDRNVFNNDRMEHHLAMAQETPIPADGQVRRILDMGTGFGAFATSLKERFPEAEVWGIDVGAPMVRWAHYRAVKMNLDVNFAQRLAEDTKFPDGHFDVVVSYIMHHEVHPDVQEKIVAEAYRVLRPGGSFFPVDFVTKGNPRYMGFGDIMRKASIWQDHRYNNEVWSPSYRETDLPGLMRKVGFTDMKVSAKTGTAFQDVLGFKPA